MGLRAAPAARFTDMLGSRRSRSGAAPTAETAAGRPGRLLRPAAYLAVVAALVLLLGAAGVLWFMRHDTTHRFERATGFHTRYVANTILRSNLRATDFHRPVAEARRAELDRLFRSEVLVEGSLRVNLWRSDGTITYSSDHVLIGTRVRDSDELRVAFSGRTVHDVSRLGAEGGPGGDRKVLEAYAPVPLPGTTRTVGVFELYQDYAPVAASTREVVTRLALALVLVVLALYAAFLVMLRRVAAAFERRRRRARKSEERLHLALQAAQMGIVEFDLERQTVTMSNELEALYGLPAGFEGTFDSVFALVHPDDRERVRETVLGADPGGSGFELEYRVVRPDGSVRWRVGSGRVFPDAAGEPRRIIAVGRDITQRKEAEEKLRVAEQKYRTLVEQLPLVSYVEGLDAESAMYVSPQIASLVGYTAEEWVSDPSFFGKALHSEDRERVLSGFATMHRTGEPFECEYRLIAHDGHVVWIHDSAVVSADESGRPLYAQGYMLNITERKLSEQALRESQERLREQMQTIEHQAFHDGLTNLPNRTLFFERIEQALLAGGHDGASFAVMLLDLDRFKEVNDTLGHQSGDLLLRAVGARLRSCLREGDTVARLGGDEFGVLARGVSNLATAVKLADKLREEVAKPILVAGLALEVEASVGIALSPAQGDDVETLNRHADVAMYVSKETHAPAVYAAEHDHYSPARLALVGELRRGLERRELVLHFQPQVDAASGEVKGFEALVRWQHRKHGLLMPDKFVPLAEHTGLIRPLTRYVLDEALRQNRAWRRQGRDLTVSVNITGRELLDVRFPDEVAELLAKWDVPPAQLELEITENTILTDPPRAHAILTRLSELGVRLAIDDFGSGHSSLGYLKRLPVDVLKIDKSFVLRMAESEDDAVIVRSTIELGHNLGLEVVAEGIETEDVRSQLAALGCDLLQGYLLGRPAPAAASRVVAERPAKRSAAL